MLPSMVTSLLSFVLADQNNVTNDGLLEQNLPLDDVGLNILDADITVNEINTACYRHPAWLLEKH